MRRGSDGFGGRVLLFVAARHAGLGVLTSSRQSTAWRRRAPLNRLKAAMTSEERARLTELVALDNNDDLGEAVRLCAQLRGREPDPLAFSVIQSVLEEIGDILDSGPLSVDPWERVREQLVPVLRRVIQLPSAAEAAELARCWARLKQEEPLR